MGKLPYFNFYPSDWTRDMHKHPLKIAGAWITICCELHWSEPRGKATNNLDEWARILGTTPEDTKEILEYISLKGICDVTQRNGNITVMSRRIYREEMERISNRENNKLRQQKYRSNRNVT